MSTSIESAIKWYNSIMYDVCHEHVTIGTRYSDGTDEWNLRDMVSEVQYTLDLWNDPGSLVWEDAHSCPEEYKEWLNEKGRMKRFIARYAEEAMKMECTAGHCSKFD